MRGTVFLGSKRQGLIALQALRSVQTEPLRMAITIDDSDDERSVLPAMRAYAAESGIDLRVAENPKQGREFMLNAGAIRCFVSGWYWLIDGGALDAMPGGVFGVHNSLLPAYRGGAPVVWAIMNGETEVGASIFQIGKGMDDGNVFAQLRVDVGPDDHVGAVLSRLEARVQSELPEIWRGVVDGSAEGEEQDHSQATYCGLRKPSDGRIDWTWTAKRVHDFVRAQTPPYPGAFALHRNREVRILRTSVFDRPYLCTPGQVLLRTDSGALVGCGGDTAIRLERVRVGEEEFVAQDVFKSINTRLAYR